MKKRITALLLCIFMLISTFPTAALALNIEETVKEIAEGKYPVEEPQTMAEAPLSEAVGAEDEEKDILTATASCSGICGENLTWTLDEKGVLTISGTGAMTDYTSGSTLTPWYKYKAEIKSVDILPGVTGIGECAFYNCSGLTSVSIPDSVTSIGDYAFWYCTALISVTIPGSVSSIEYAAFANCERLRSVILSDGVSIIDGYAFYYCAGLASVTLPASVTDVGEAAFANCSNLTGIYVSSDNSTYCSVNGVLFILIRN